MASTGNPGPGDAPAGPPARNPARNPARGPGDGPACDPRRNIPKTDALLARPEFAAFADQLGRRVVVERIRLAQADARAGRRAPGEVAARALADLARQAGNPTTLRRVLNATGIVLHTNLGRARLAPQATEALATASGYCDIEFDVADGSRARRGRGTLTALSDRLPSGAGALVVNNGAAALLLVAAWAISHGRPEIVISRGELVEIGDGFRIPELLATTGAQLREVGTTNRTHLRDYEQALTPRTGLVLKVHPSNYRIHGFTRSVDIPELAPLCRAAGVRLVADLGSGLLSPDPALPDEPDASTTLAAGADLVTGSGDKLLGGPQAGLLLGDASLVEELRRHPIARALRVDKTTLAALEATLRGGPTPTQSAVHATSETLRDRADRLLRLLGEAAPGTEQCAIPTADGSVSVQVVPSDGAVGGGSAPGLALPGWAVALPPGFAAALRRGDPAVVGRLDDGHCLLDVRCLLDDELPLVAQAVRTIAAEQRSGD